LQTDLVRGIAPLEHYAAILQQLAHVHAALEPLLRSLQSNTKFGPLIQAHHFHLHALENDLRFMHVGSATALGATARFVDLIRRAGPTPALLGVFYVLEGSTNGGTVIAKAIRTAYGWQSEAGTSFINPHGPLVRQRWAAFKAELDATNFTTEERHTILAIASATFTAYHAMLDDIHTSLTATA
jgi:heme oxygenase